MVNLFFPTSKRIAEAAAIEVASSVNGQLAPPVMGAAAFLMSEYMGIPYIQVAVYAILPAVLYFAGIYIAVHLEAKKLGLKGIPKVELPKFRNLAKKLYLLLPLVVLIYLVTSNTFTIQYSAAIAIAVAIIVSIFNKENHILYKFTEIVCTQPKVS